MRTAKVDMLGTGEPCGVQCIGHPNGPQESLQIPTQSGTSLERDILETSLRAQGTLISEPPFSTPASFPREKGKRPFQRKTLNNGHFPFEGFLAWAKSHLAGVGKSGLTK